MTQLILAAAISTQIGANTPATVKATASEPGIADLSRAVAGMSFDGTEAAHAGRLIDASYFTALAAKSGKVQLADGTGTGQMPLTLFDPLRNQEAPIGWGFHKLSAGEWIQLVMAPLPVAGNGGWAVPFIPAQGRGRVLRPSGPSSAAKFVPSGTIDKDATNGTLTFTATEAGVLDLSSLALGSAATIAGAQKDFASGLSSLFINSWTLPSGDDLVIGSGTAPSCPAEAFAAGRRVDFFDLGCIPVGSGSSVTVTLSNYGERTQTPFGAAAWWPGAVARSCGC